MTDTDQNIATLREYFDDVRPPDETCAALDALASTLAERTAEALAWDAWARERSAEIPYKGLRRNAPLRSYLGAQIATTLRNLDWETQEHQRHHDEETTLNARISALESTLAERDRRIVELEELEDRVTTIVDEEVGIQPVTPAHDLLTLLERHHGEQRRRIHELEGRLEDLCGSPGDPVGFGVDPKDSQALLHLRSAIDDALGWESLEEEEAADYCARVWQVANKLKAANQAPPAPAPGELAAGIEFCKRPGSGVPTNVIEAAESWQRLQWRPASEAPARVRVLFLVRDEDDSTRECLGCWNPETERWDDIDTEGYDSSRITWHPLQVLGFIPLDALPTLNGGDDNG